MVDVAYEPTTPVGQVRFFCSDTYMMPQVRDDGNPGFIFSDNEITMLLSMYSTSAPAAAVLLAAADCCEQIGLNEMMIGKVVTTQDLATDTSKLMAQYLKLAESLREKAARVSDDGSFGEDGILVTPMVDSWSPYRLAIDPRFPEVY